MPDPTYPLRLWFCPACGYSLVGLPPVGCCPECGQAYDAHPPWIVLRAHMPFERPRVAVGTGVLTLLIVGLLILTGRRANSAALLAIGPLTAFLSVVFAIRLANPWPNRFLLWLTPDGFRVQSTFVPGPMVRRLAFLGFTFGAYGPSGWAAYRMAVRALHRPWAVAAVVLGVAGLCWAYLQFAAWLARRLVYGRRRGDPSLWRLLRQPVPLLGRSPPPMPWDGFDVVTLRPCRDSGRHRFTAARRGRWFNVPLIQVDVELSPVAADALAHRLALWRGRGP